MRDRPGLHTDQHGMLERAPDFAAAIGRDHENACRPHQQLRDVVGPSGREPHVDPAGRAISREAVSNQNEPDEREQRHQPLVGPLPDALDHRGARSTQRDEDMRPEENDKSEHENRQPHGSSLAKAPRHSRGASSAGAVEAMARREARSWSIASKIAPAPAAGAANSIVATLAAVN